MTGMMRGLRRALRCSQVDIAWRTSSSTCSMSSMPSLEAVVGLLGELAGVGVDDADDGDDSLLGEGPAHVQRLLRRPTDAHGIDVDEPGRDGADDGRLAVDEVDHGAVVADEGPLGLDAGADGDVGVGPQVAPLPVDGEHAGGLDDVVAVGKLAGAGVTGDMDLGVALVDDVGAPAGEF